MTAPCNMTRGLGQTLARLERVARHVDGRGSSACHSGHLRSRRVPLVPVAPSDLNGSLNGGQLPRDIAELAGFAENVIGERIAQVEAVRAVLFRARRGVAGSGFACCTDFVAALRKVIGSIEPAAAGLLSDMRAPRRELDRGPRQSSAAVMVGGGLLGVLLVLMLSSQAIGRSRLVGERAKAGPLRPLAQVAADRSDAGSAPFRAASRDRGRAASESDSSDAPSSRTGMGFAGRERASTCGSSHGSSSGGGDQVDARGSFPPDAAGETGCSPISAEGLAGHAPESAARRGTAASPQLLAGAGGGAPATTESAADWLPESLVMGAGVVVSPRELVCGRGSTGGADPDAAQMPGDQDESAARAGSRVVIDDEVPVGDPTGVQRLAQVHGGFQSTRGVLLEDGPWVIADRGSRAVVVALYDRGRIVDVRSFRDGTEIKPTHPLDGDASSAFDHRRLAACIDAARSRAEVVQNREESAARFERARRQATDEARARRRLAESSAVREAARQARMAAIAAAEVQRVRSDVARWIATCVPSRGCFFAGPAAAERAMPGVPRPFPQPPSATVRPPSQVVVPTIDVSQDVVTF